MKRFLFWQRWLFIASLLIIVGGIMITLFSGVGAFTLLDRLINPVFWKTTDINAASKSFQQWIYGLLGAIMAGWGVTMAFLTHYPFRQRERWARHTMALSLLIWYVPDTVVSLLFGVNFNALLNTVTLVLFLLPLIFTRRHFSKEAHQRQPTVA